MVKLTRPFSNVSATLDKYLSSSPLSLLANWTRPPEIFMKLSASSLEKVMLTTKYVQNIFI